ncbi:hypothetical protein DFJ58DRAFT_790622 [Suillus subalutaceus]|uniref:uncharacterized protein n=1 Tax=Suillus subalutaceus TaxID=48586 RepID=UPI001B85F75E|nr:uncharacterized protein DFJ58DRAFT_790622 [Suillus subalutaceus]KAG1852795.1 hypothetical protein DFJ58DRAFT_790622 [Suillus subalutaceus]
MASPNLPSDWVTIKAAFANREDIQDISTKQDPQMTVYQALEVARTSVANRVAESHHVKNVKPESMEIFASNLEPFTDALGERTLTAICIPASDGDHRIQKFPERVVRAENDFKNLMALNKRSLDRIREMDEKHTFLVDQAFKDKEEWDAQASRIEVEHKAKRDAEVRDATSTAIHSNEEQHLQKAQLMDTKRMYKAQLAEKEAELKAVRKRLTRAQKKTVYPIALRALLDESQELIRETIGAEHPTWEDLRGTKTVPAICCLRLAASSAGWEAAITRCY